MAPGLHGAARTTPRVRAELRAAREATRALAAGHGLNPETVAGWRRRAPTADAPRGPRRSRGSVLTGAEEAIVVESRRRTLLPLDDVLGCLRETIPALSRGALHRCFRRHGISRLPRAGGKAPKRTRFAETVIGYVHIDVRELHPTRGKLFVSLPTDRVLRFAHVAFFDATARMNGAAFPREVVKVFPHGLHAALTDNRTAFADQPRDRGRDPGIEVTFGGHIPGRACDQRGIGHKLTKPHHPWTNGQAERMNRTVKEATIKAFHRPDLDALEAHVLALVAAYNFARHLKAPRWRTPF